VVAAVTLPVTLAAVTNVAVLSSHKLVAEIATLRTIAVVALAIVTLGAVAVLGEAGAPIGILGSAAVLWVGTRTALGRAAIPMAGLLPGRFTTVAGELIRSGIPYAASTLAGTGIQLAIPILVAIQLDTEAAGFYRAATQISAGYVTFIAAAMLQDSYPRLSREQAHPATLVALIDQQLLLVMMLTFPLILTGMAFSNVIMPVLYSAAFGPAVAIVGWQLVGTLLRLPSWTLSFAILARGRSRVYFAVELLGGLALLGGSLVGIDRFGLAGLGGAVLLTYLVYYPLVWLAVRRDLPLGVTAAQKALLGTVGLAAAIQALSLFDLELLRQALAMALAAAWLIADAALFRRMWRGRGDRTGVGPDRGRRDEVAEIASAVSPPEAR
jgi:PST family polysaccharide transporter